jgi:hypothetical protein
MGGPNSGRRILQRAPVDDKGFSEHLAARPSEGDVLADDRSGQYSIEADQNCLSAKIV